MSTLGAMFELWERPPAETVDIVLLSCVTVLFLGIAVVVIVLEIRHNGRQK